MVPWTVRQGAAAAATPRSSSAAVAPPSTGRTDRTCRDDARHEGGQGAVACVTSSVRGDLRGLIVHASRTRVRRPFAGQVAVPQDPGRHGAPRTPTFSAKGQLLLGRPGRET